MAVNLRSRFNEFVVRQILYKTMMMAPRSDFALAKYLIDATHVGSPVKSCLEITVDKYM